MMKPDIRNPPLAALILGALILVAALAPLLLLPLLFVVTLALNDPQHLRPARAVARTRRSGSRAEFDRGPPRA